jgi:hypothetical protein
MAIKIRESFEIIENDMIAKDSPTCWIGYPSPNDRYRESSEKVSPPTTKIGFHENARPHKNRAPARSNV